MLYKKNISTVVLIIIIKKNHLKTKMAFLSAGWPGIVWFKKMFNFDAKWHTRDWCQSDIITLQDAYIEPRYSQNKVDFLTFWDNV